VSLVRDARLGLVVDARRMGLGQEDVDAAILQRALDEMAALEAGAIANPSEGRQVGHYWLRAPELAPAELQAEIAALPGQVEALVQGLSGFTDFLLCGIGGSALGPQLLADALPVSGLRPHFLDNTDPAGLARTLEGLDLRTTLVLVFSKSGGTKETRNALAEVEAALEAAGLSLAPRAVAVTVSGSKLSARARSEGWLGELPLWDWVGGRTSISGAVGLLPMALMGQDLRAFQRGLAACDVATRRRRANPALTLAAAWHRAQRDRPRAMVVLPYRDGLQLLSRYLQQLVMESLGKNGRGLTVYGNKGSTDQHAYVQQLRDGPDDFFGTFVWAGFEDAGVEVEPGVHTADYLLGFLLGTRRALSQVGKASLTLTLERLDAFHLGVLVALYERAVGLYASVLGVNAYDQPGVEAGKVAAGEMLELQARLLAGEALPEDDEVELIAGHLLRTGR
jgi:glucose-6-phosphate isomerase